MTWEKKEEKSYRKGTLPFYLSVSPVLKKKQLLNVSNGKREGNEKGTEITL